MAATTTFGVLITTLIQQHGFVITPTSRNSVDKDLPLYANGSFPNTNGKPGCTPTEGACGCWCTNGTEPCAPGQSCFWFSQGCSIGCKECDGVSARAQQDLCNSGMQARVCDPKLRTYNRYAACNSDADTYKHNPWRAPGTAPLFDACGRAGGGNSGPGVGGGAAFFVNSTHNKEGDLGSQVLPYSPSGTVWKVGTFVEASWGMRANHGGGYQYRLCPRSANLTEDCLKKTPMRFAGQQFLQFANGSKLSIPSSYSYENGTGVFTAEGGIPELGAWAVNPIPDHSQEHKGQLEFPPPCHDDTSGPTNGLCSGERPFHISIIDVLEVPDVPAGEYVLGWRWDCEETAQIWTTCADITIAV